MARKKSKMQQSWKDSMVKPGVKYAKKNYDTKIYGCPWMEYWSMGEQEKKDASLQLSVQEDGTGIPEGTSPRP